MASQFPRTSHRDETAPHSENEACDDLEVAKTWAKRRSILTAFGSESAAHPPVDYPKYVFVQLFCERAILNMGVVGHGLSRRPECRLETSICCKRELNVPFVTFSCAGGSSLKLTMRPATSTWHLQTLPFCVGVSTSILQPQGSPNFNLPCSALPV